MSKFKESFRKSTMRKRLIFLFLSSFIFSFNLHSHSSPFREGLELAYYNPQETSFQNLRKVDWLLVRKEERRLYLIKNNKIFAYLPIAVGRNEGKKRKTGDKKTPEGWYRVTFKNPRSTYYRSFGISYPNEEDQDYANRRGLNPGNNITIHGVRPNDGLSYEDNYEATRGCISLSNEDIERLWPVVSVGTPLLIEP